MRNALRVVKNVQTTKNVYLAIEDISSIQKAQSAQSANKIVIPVNMLQTNSHYVCPVMTDFIEM